METIRNLVTPLAVVAALGGLSTVEVELPEVFVEAQSIELRDRFYDLVTPSEHVVWAVGKSGKIIRSNDQAHSFSVQNTPTISHLQSISAWDDRRAVVVGNNGTTLNTSDGGVTWDIVKAPLNDIGNKIFSVDIAPNGRVWATAEFGSVLFSDDKGKSWTRVGTDEDVAWNDVGFAADGRVCVIGEFGGLACSDDSGDSWQRKDSPVENSMMGIAFSDGHHGVGVGLNGKLIRTDDAGETWRLVESPTSKQFYGLAWDDDKWLIVGEKGALLTYYPEQDSWTTEDLGPRGNIWHTAVVSSHDRIYLAGQKLGYTKQGALVQFGRAR